MEIDFTAVEQFLTAMQGQVALEQALAHPAYRTVFEHGRRYGNPLEIEDVRAALAGKPSRFFGLRGLAENLPRIQALLVTLRAHQDDWPALAVDELTRLLPGCAPESIAIYPILGYDMGIGLRECVCLNLNTPQYLAEPAELLYFIIHEMVHVLYERSHAVPPLAEVRSERDWQDYFALWLQNEGFAVYAPFRLRAAHNHLNDRDYQALCDPASLSGIRRAFTQTLQRLNSQPPLTDDENLEAVFGDQRVTYRAGCEIFRQIEQRDGLPGVRRAFHLPPNPFLAQYAHLISAPAV